MDIHPSNVIVDANNTTLFADINATDTTITVGNATTLDDPKMMKWCWTCSGVIYIGNERITYEAIDGNVLKFPHKRYTRN